MSAYQTRVTSGDILQQQWMCRALRSVIFLFQHLQSLHFAKINVVINTVKQFFGHGRSSETKTDEKNRRGLTESLNIFGSLYMKQNIENDNLSNSGIFQDFFYIKTK